MLVEVSFFTSTWLDLFGTKNNALPPLEFCFSKQMFLNKVLIKVLPITLVREENYLVIFFVSVFGEENFVI